MQKKSLEEMEERREGESEKGVANLTFSSAACRKIWKTGKFEKKKIEKKKKGGPEEIKFNRNFVRNGVTVIRKNVWGTENQQIRGKGINVFNVLSRRIWTLTCCWRGGPWGERGKKNQRLKK